MKVRSEKLSDQAETTMAPPDTEQVPQVLPWQGGSERPRRAPSTPEQPPNSPPAGGAARCLTSLPGSDGCHPAAPSTTSPGGCHRQTITTNGVARDRGTSDSTG